MMRKLAVTVFALSLAALGCGSDSGTKTTDSAVTPPLDGAKADTTVPSPDIIADVPIGAEVQVALDGAKIEVSAVDSPLLADQAPGVDQAPQVLDTAKPVDTQVIDGAKPDAGLDTRPVDSGSAVDSGSLDGGTAG